MMNDTITYEDIKNNLRSCRKALINADYTFKYPAEYAFQTLILLRDSIKEVNDNGA